ncbi:hypothetical protein P7D22_17300 [Lichenihabitans sp. Uapishka_5]|uniref:hypothetical protein n=1 Tax=Lichenihabitans sp. Uapishka_5 TaxID=3037302 RepID=UPI0029E80D9B|nr:hypothetical protein [Lichenihabitans sp. Uapishka_5]MDX7952924.1 hypothetical protein [Lichenihabitans sp. Uapishka_5]
MMSEMGRVDFDFDFGLVIDLEENRLKKVAGHRALAFVDAKGLDAVRAEYDGADDARYRNHLLSLLVFGEKKLAALREDCSLDRDGHFEAIDRRAREIEIFRMSDMHLGGSCIQ